MLAYFSIVLLKFDVIIKNKTKNKMKWWFLCDSYIWQLMCSENGLDSNDHFLETNDIHTVKFYGRQRLLRIIARWGHIFLQLCFTSRFRSALKASLKNMATYITCIHQEIIATTKRTYHNGVHIRWCIYRESNAKDDLKYVTIYNSTLLQHTESKYTAATVKNVLWFGRKLECVAKLIHLCIFCGTPNTFLRPQIIIV